MLRALLRESRPKQWLKNILVFAAPGAAGVLDEGHNLILTVVAFVSFCFAASGIYIWNDLLDVDADRRHPTKRNRPIASGELSVGVARVAGVAFPIIALALAAATGRWQTVAVVATYIVITIAYTLHLKHVPVVDLVTVAAGFVLRAAAGVADAEGNGDKSGEQRHEEAEQQPGPEPPPVHVGNVHGNQRREQADGQSK